MTPIIIPNIIHPEYRMMLAAWHKFRLTFEGGESFKNAYLYHFSTRETQSDYSDRKDLTYVPAHAKSAIKEINNAIHQRMVDVIRKGGTTSYQKAIVGDKSGVDLAGNTMNGFIGRYVLPELLTMAKVGVYIDRFQLNEMSSRRDAMAARPYLYIYRAEDIRSWVYNNENQLTNLLLRDCVLDIDPITGLATSDVEQYRLLALTPEGVLVTIYNAKGNQTQQYLLNLKAIPFVLFEISDSLLTDIADYQIALMNLSSSDMSYAMKSNFPFYTEQYSPLSELSNLRQASETSDSEAGTAASATVAKRPELKIGAAQGRRYPINTERPDFIHPSPEPLKVSMEKQEQLKKEIRQIIHLAVSHLETRRASSESKQEDEKGLEAGLSALGQELDYGERQIAEFWAMYERETVSVTIQYPHNYTLRSDTDRRKEATDLEEIIHKVPSLSFQKEMAKEIISIVAGPKVTQGELEVMQKEIDAAPVVVIDPDVIAADLEQGLLTRTLASVIRLYPKGEAEKAKIEHAERAAAIVAAQSDMGARGVDDLGEDNAARREKEASRNSDLDAAITNKTRGEGK